MFLCKRTDDALDLPLPSRQSSQAAGMDLHANVHEELTLQPGAREKISTGICLALPEGYEAQVRPRSGLAFKFGVTMLNGPGTIDADYRGEVGVLLINLGQEPFTVRRGDRIAQLVIARVQMVDLIETKELPDSNRAAGGYGSTGI
ncbi:MAG: dUTP diphosphatase [Defluviitaleaceae bacterium]|nr:dUTP diphosphatase [Defluviitaleaceae bacterium]